MDAPRGAPSLHIQSQRARQLAFPSTCSPSHFIPPSNLTTFMKQCGRSPLPNCFQHSLSTSCSCKCATCMISACFHGIYRCFPRLKDAQCSTASLPIKASVLCVSILLQCSTPFKVSSPRVQPCFHLVHSLLRRLLVQEAPRPRLR